MNTTVEYHARYSDGYSYQVLYDPAERKTYLATDGGGRMDVPYYMNGNTLGNCGRRWISCSQFPRSLLNHQRRQLMIPACTSNRGNQVSHLFDSFRKPTL